MREVKFVIHMDVPEGPADRNNLRNKMHAMAKELGVFGNTGKYVGVGFYWLTRNRAADGGMKAIATRLHRIHRALESSGLVSSHARTYLLETRFVYTHEDPNVLFTLKEHA